MAAPVTQKIGTPFGRKGAWAAGYHPGEDYPCAPGTPVKAAADGKVIYRGNGGGWGGAYGTQVIVESKGTDGRTYRWIVAHLTPNSWKVKAGDSVKLGRVIGLSGFSGNVRPAGPGGAHVHFEVRAYNRSTRDWIFGYWDHVNPTVIRNVTGTAPSKPSTNKMDPAAYFTGAVGAHVTWLGERLVLHGFGKHYTTGPGPVWGEADRKNVRDFQIAQGWTGDGADGFPGALTLTRLAAALSSQPVPAVPSVILPRSAWTSTPDGRDTPLQVAKVTAFTVHYPADGDVTYRDLIQSEVAALLRAYQESHLKRGWKDIGYNYAVDQAGRTWFLTGDNIGAHSGDAGNPTSIAVLFVVGNNESPTPAAIAAFRLLRASKLPRFPKATKVQGHQQVPGNSTACPGAPLMALITSGMLTGAPAPQPVPPDVPDQTKDKTSQRAFVLNVNKNRITKSGTNRDSVGAFTDVKKGLDYKDRLPLLAAKAARVKGSTVLTQEAGKYADGDAFAKALGPEWKSILHGDGRGDLTQAVVLDTDKRRIVGEGSFKTSTSPNHHNTATWVVAEDIATGIRICWGTSHMEYRTGAAYDKIREAQTRKFLTELEKIAKRFGTTFIIAGADYNSDDQQSYDGPGRAAKALGFKDAEHIAKTKKNAEFGTTIDVGGVDERVSDRHIDRFLIKGNITVAEWGIDIVLNAKGDLIKPHATDHLGVWISFTATKAA